MLAWPATYGTFAVKEVGVLATFEKPMQPFTPFTDSTPLLGDEAALRARAECDGYLFFRALLPREDVMDVRRDLLRVVEDAGWRAPDQESLGGRLQLDVLADVPADEMRLDVGVSTAMYHAAQRLESPHALPHHPRLLALYRDLFGEEVLVHPRHIIRMITAHPAMVATPRHQDFPLIQGTPATWTAWIPLGDCSREMGGLAVLRASHRLGYVPIAEAAGAGGIEAQLCQGEDDWFSTDYQAGDVLTFPSYTVHRGLPATRRDEVRLSLDVRYQNALQPVETRSLLPHCELSWDEIYAHWKDSSFQRYWESMPLEISGWDDALVQPSRRIC